ncbi:transmembrane protein, putative (macronuclear) [Tetrahymena thermophila SB210]|uniref:Transmembrane protein, putative n=1 Tax=Tetrahymena thermophila (strain SB210) TaxID=312017 RepID=Q241Q9_TETTS|nr:transmembrane protein, putative [Tetrahymena thermophila SB210]EAS02511.2 transmembrane protein, putative [Tetrahymena thermophila SB210]|eukprot:XP_001022756.2 transmembrane protein, putative [Tetrahymena thermophila SB210]
MTKQLVFFTLTLLLATQCFAFVNIRGFKSLQDVSQCKLPCYDIIDQVMPGAILGMNYKYSGSSYQRWFEKSNINYCCEQKKTYDFLDGMIVPDFMEVEKANFVDQEQITSEISPAPKTEKFKYKINIVHEFQRRALNISADMNQFRVNMTNVESIVPDINQCDTSYDIENKCWLSAVHLLGEQVFTKLTLGSYQKVNLTIYTNSKYDQKQAIQIYKTYIIEKGLENINEAFKSDESPSIAVKFNYLRKLIIIQRN